MSTLSDELRDALARRYYDGLIATLGTDEGGDGLPAPFDDLVRRHGKKKVLMMLACKHIDSAAEGIAALHRENPTEVMEAMYVAGTTIAATLLFVDENGMEDGANIADAMP